MPIYQRLEELTEGVGVGGGGGDCVHSGATNGTWIFYYLSPVNNEVAGLE